MDGRRHGLSDPTLSGGGLDRRKPYKPLDVGNGVVSGTLTPSGRLLSLGIAHPVHGRVELTTAPPFTGDGLVQAAVRAYRAMLAEPQRLSFGFDLLDGEPTRVDLLADSFPYAFVERAQGRFEVTTIAPRGRQGVVQILRIEARASIRGPSWGGAIRLARAEFTQLTPGGALPPAPERNRSKLEGGDLLWVDDPALGAAAAIAQSPALALEEGDVGTAVLAIALAEERSTAVGEARALAAQGEALAARELADRRTFWTGLALARPDAAAIRRGVAYALDESASRSGEAVAVLADHVILPLVWTRDAYFVCRALLAAGPQEPSIVAAIEGFLRFTFQRAERVGGWWPRASLASGQAKDPVFQLDQQLWPLLLIADYARLTNDPGIHVRFGAVAGAAIELLLRQRKPFGLIATEETPADDPLSQPYHFSSHVLLWHVLDVFKDAAAQDVRAAALRHFESEGRFAYAIAGPDAEGARDYHDANDFPTVFAPGWGFCHADDPRWRATIDFGWSRANEGYFDGPLGGLGSTHTPHPWPLGDLQEIIVARVTNDPARERRAKERLARVETWDGMLPEAYDETSGAVASRHWFAWPTALRALLEREPMLTAP
jgi:hypothetical protein